MGGRYLGQGGVGTLDGGEVPWMGEGRYLGWG